MAGSRSRIIRTSSLILLMTPIIITHAFLLALFIHSCKHDVYESVFLTLLIRANKEAPTANGQKLYHLFHLRHTNICVLCYGRNPSASTHLRFGAATWEGFSIDSTHTASQLLRLSVIFKKMYCLRLRL